MSNSPFYRSYNSDLHSLSRARHAPSVREIPVQFVGSERQEIRPEGRSESAVKIQKVFRGFLVRKSVKKIAEIRAEVEEIERRMLEKETVELIENDSKERLRVIETLMRLLFKLDSVRGVDSGVRDCRKSVIKRAIALQETLDSIACNKKNNNVNQTVEDDHDPDHGQDNNVNQTVEDDRDPDHDQDQDYDDVDRTAEEECKEIVNDEVVEECCPEESVGTSQTDSRSDSVSVNPESLVEACEENDDDGDVKESKERVRNREVLLGRMVEENEKMMDLMAQLFERNQMQTRLLSSLSQRVEQLERAFLCDKLRRKKKRQAAAGTGDECDASSDVKKCGKR